MLHKDTSEVVCTRAISDYHRWVRTEESPAGFGIMIVWIPSFLHYWETRCFKLVSQACERSIPHPPCSSIPVTSRGDRAAFNYVDAANLLFDQQKQPFLPRQRRRRLSTPPLRVIHHLRVHAPLRLGSPLRYCDRGAVGSENCVILNPQLDSVLCSCVRKRAKLFIHLLRYKKQQRDVRGSPGQQYCRCGGCVHHRKPVFCTSCVF